MAKAYRAPIEPPDFNYATWREDEQRYLADLRDRALSDAHIFDTAKAGLVGEVIRFQVADGYAQYMVWQQSPLSLIHIATMDGYSIPEAHIRGLRLADVKDLVARERRMRELFGGAK